MTFKDKQESALNSKVRFLLLSGGFRSGKTLCALVKLIAQHMTQPKNRILIGRLTYPELRDTVQKDFFALLPPEWIAKWSESNGELTLKNGTEVLFRHLDTVSEMELRGMTLGAAFIDQAEEISESVFQTLTSRLNLPYVNQHQIIMTSNPLLFWAYKFFKQENGDDRELIEFSMLDNKDNLPEEYLRDMLRKPENWKRQFVYGVWDESLLADRAVIPVEYIREQKAFIKKPKRKFDDIDIYRDAEDGHEYQIGFDLSEGIGQDYSVLSGFDIQTGEQVCFGRFQIQPDLFATMKAVPILNYFNKALAVPEINGIGLAFLTRLKEKYDNIYIRETFDRDGMVETEQLGWKTSFATKPLLVDHFIKLMREGQLQLRSEETVNEMATFCYNETSKTKGMGAREGFHDDCLIAAMLGTWKINPSVKGFGAVATNFDNLLGSGKAGW